jgi:hypothetical protein
MGGWLLFPGFSGDVQKATGLPPEEELKWRKAGGGLGHLPNAKQDAR